jgi:hypothetical protein
MILRDNTIATKLIQKRDFSKYEEVSLKVTESEKQKW